jgi:putative transposase
MQKYSSNGNSKFNISYHIVWIPKYRKRILTDDIEKKLKQLLNDKLISLDLHNSVIECMPDHIHLFIRSNPNYSVSFIVKMLKGYTSYILRQHFSQLRKYRSLWAPGYFCETIGNITEKTVIKYIKNQKYV